MKTIFLSIILAVFALSVNAQKAENKINESAVPEGVKKAFNEKHPGMKALKWELDNGKYEVDFKNGKAKYIAVFSPEGKWLITGTELKKKDVPKKIMDHALSGEYKDWKFNQARSVETAEIPKEIIVEVEKGDDDTMLYYDADGNFLKAKKE
ncbi:MAG: PepSY-like domain-containing protein [Bacteroidota bacterium]|nr:PepSY-like domain-containing protein [Bacteroidota bacterium]